MRWPEFWDQFQLGFAWWFGGAVAVLAALYLGFLLTLAAMWTVRSSVERRRAARQQKETHTAQRWEPQVVTDPSYITIGVQRHGGRELEPAARLARISVHAEDVQEQIAVAWANAQATAALLNDPAGWVPPAGAASPVDVL